MQDPKRASGGVYKVGARTDGSVVWPPAGIKDQALLLDASA